MTQIAFFDIETDDADALYSAGPGYVRLCGVAVTGIDSVGITDDPAKLIRVLEKADVIVAHHGSGFDLPAIARHCGADYDALSAKLIDSLRWAQLQDPPGSKHSKPWGEKGYYGLDRLAQRHGAVGKITGEDGLPALAKEFGGFGLIPTTDARYRAYLRQDVVALRDTFEAMGGYGAVTDYVRREMRVAHLQNRMTLSGWRVDEQLLKERVAAEEKRQADAVEFLASEGLPLGRSVMRGRGAAKAEVWEPHTSPLSTTEGIAWMGDVWERFGVKRPPRTDKGRLALGKDKLAVVRQHPKCPEQLARILDAVADFTGASAKYAEVSKFVVDGRVHARIGSEEATDQASGRWAMTKPSLTNLGKRGAKVAQRGVFTAEEDCVLIAVDLDQVDMRGIAAHCQDPAYLQLFGPGVDAHSMITDRVFGRRNCGCTGDRHTCEWRDLAKKIGHGWNYGMGVEGQMRNGVERERAVQFDRQMTEQFPVLCSWRQEVRDRGKAGELLDNGFGRLMRCDEGRAHTQAPALMGQGTARDLMTTAMLQLAEAVPESVKWFRGVVHDEIVLSVPEKHWREIGDEVVKAFTFSWRGVPITAGLSKPGFRWDECYAKG